MKNKQRKTLLSFRFRVNEEKSILCHWIVKILIVLVGMQRPRFPHTLLKSMKTSQGTVRNIFSMDLHYHLATPLLEI